MSKLALLAFALGMVLPHALGASGKPDRPPNPFLTDGGRPLIIAHGGAKELRPGNTLLAFRFSAELGVDILEADIAMTRDGVLITHHDLTVDRTSNGTGRVSDLSYDEILELDFGAHFTDASGKRPYAGHPEAVPATVEQLFERYGEFLFVLELKDRGAHGLRAADEMVGLISRFGFEDRVLVASFDDEIIGRVRTLGGARILTATSRSEATRFVILGKLGLGFLYRAKADAFEVPTSERAAGVRLRLDRKHLIRLAHRKRMAVHYWTVNDIEEMRRLIELGADGIITDRPDRMREVLGLE